MNKNDLIKYADYLLKTAMYKEPNINDAQDLVQETLLTALVAIEEEKDIQNPKNWLVTVLNRKHYDRLRLKYRIPTVCIDVAYNTAQEDAMYDRLEKSADAEKIRMCLAYLTKLYREVMVRFYMHGKSVKAIAEELNIPENTVKSRLDTGRKHIRKDFTMENYIKQSYEPEKLWVSNAGQESINGEPYTLVRNDMIIMNLLIIAYDKPVTIPEIAKAIGISTTFIEPIIDKLVKGELMKRVSDKVYTDFIIYTDKDRKANFKLSGEIAENIYKDIWVFIDKGLEELRQQSYYKSQTKGQQIKLEGFFAVRTLHNAINRAYDKISGESLPFEEYPERPNGGKWFALGNRYPSEWHGDEYINYDISGMAGTSLSDYCGLKKIELCEYDTALGEVYQGYANKGILKHPMKTEDVLKMLYAVYSDREEDLAVINAHCYDNIEGLTQLSFLSKDNDGKVIVDIPVLEMHEKWNFFDLTYKYSPIIFDKFFDRFKKLGNNPVKLPPHLKSVPAFQIYMPNFQYLPMQIILNAKENGLFLKGIQGNLPAVLLAYQK